MTTHIKQSDLLNLSPLGTGSHYGGDQDWFRSFWQRKAGCGPTTGANILYYFARTGRLNLPLEVKDREGFVDLMEHSWGYLTPGVMGLNSPFKMQEGLQKMLAQLNVIQGIQVLDIPASEEERPDLLAVESFIRAGLLADSPVAFLNLHNGSVAQLEGWHWVTVVGMTGEGEHALLDIVDNGSRLQVNLHQWLSTTRRGGGFVYAAISGQAA